VLKIHQNIYGQKEAGRVRNNFLIAKLKKIGFVQSRINPCIFTRGQTLYALYTDNSILASSSEKEIDKIMEDMRAIGLDITDKGNVLDFLGVKIEKKIGSDRQPTIHLTQPHLINSILKDLQLDHETTSSKPTPMSSSRILFRHSSSKPFGGHFHYRSVISRLEYLLACSRPELAYSVHQCARFSSDPKVEHGKAIMWIGKYLLATRDKGIIMTPNDSKSFKVSVDANFCGNWDQSDAAEDSNTARSRHGFLISYAGCPVMWKSKMQTEIALSSTELEVIGL